MLEETAKRGKGGSGGSSTIKVTNVERILFLDDDDRLVGVVDDKVGDRARSSHLLHSKQRQQADR